MKLGIVSDLHGDAIALREALAAMDALRCDVVVCAGDLVDYGRDAEATIGILRERRIPTIRGNHDRWAIGETSLVRTRTKLSTASIDFLLAAPVLLDLELDGVRVAIRHGTPESDMRGIYPRIMSGADLRAHLDSVRADVLVVGHTHVPFRIDLPGRGVLVNPGALLRDPNERFAKKAILFDPYVRRLVAAGANAGGTFGVLELPSKTFTVHRAADGAAIPAPEMTLR